MPPLVPACRYREWKSSKNRSPIEGGTMSNVATLSKPALEAGARPQPIIPTNIEQVYRLADAVSKSGMAPRGMEKPETITIAIMHGLEIGLTPLQALQRIAVINGRPAIWGDGAMGLVRASGLCE